MTIKIFIKSAVDFHSKMGAYAFILDDGLGGKMNKCSKFKTPVKTLAHADCAACVNALHILSLTLAALEVDELEIITDSKVVIELIQEFKAQKHCDEIAFFWKERLKPKFERLQNIKFTKVSRKPMPGDKNAFSLKLCEDAAGKELTRLKEITR